MLSADMENRNRTTEQHAHTSGSIQLFPCSKATTGLGTNKQTNQKLAMTFELHRTRVAHSSARGRQRQHQDTVRFILFHSIMSGMGTIAMDGFAHPPLGRPRDVQRHRVASLETSAACHVIGYHERPCGGGMCTGVSPKCCTPTRNMMRSNWSRRFVVDRSLDHAFLSNGTGRIERGSRRPSLRGQKRR